MNTWELTIAALSVAAVVTNGLLAGLFFVCSCAVVPGFRRVDDVTYVRAFQAINRAILNAFFLPVFLLAPLSALAVAIIAPIQVAGVPASALWVAAAGSVATFFITGAANVPLNTALDRAAPTSPAAFAAARRAFEDPGARWNLLRTLTSTLALGALATAFVLP